MPDLGVLGLVILALAVARISRLITEDTLTQPIRDWIMTKEAGWKQGKVGAVSLTTLINCHWCAGIWVTAGVIGLSWVDWLWWLWTGLAVAQVAAMVNERESV